MFIKLPLIAAALCLVYTVVMLIASIPGGDCGGGYMLFAAIGIPWHGWGIDVTGPKAYLFFVINVLMVVAIAAVTGALMDLSAGRRLLPQKRKKSSDA